MVGEAPPVLTLYSRHGCHLCRAMIDALRPLRRRHRFEIAIVDVDRDPVLRQRYGDDVPVLMHEERVLCRHRLALREVADFLAGRS